MFFEICSCRRIKLIWSYSLSWKKPSSLRVDRQSAFSDGKVRGRCIMSLWPPDPSSYSWKLICIPHMLWSKAQRGTRDQEVEKRHSSNGNVISLTGGMSVKSPWPGGNWIGYDGCCTISKCILQQNVRVHRNTTSSQDKRQNKNQETSKPNYFIFGVSQYFLELTGMVMKENDVISCM